MQMQNKSNYRNFLQNQIKLNYLYNRNDYPCSISSQNTPTNFLMYSTPASISNNVNLSEVPYGIIAFIKKFRDGLLVGQYLGKKNIIYKIISSIQLIMMNFNHTSIMIIIGYCHTF